MPAFVIVAIIVILIIVALKLIKIKPKEKPKSLMDKLNEIPEFIVHKDFYEAIQTLNQDGVETDILKEGYGEFGHDITNPIPTNTPYGSILYLEALRTVDGIKVEYERIGSMNTPNIDYPVNQYKIFVNSNQIATLYLTIRNKKNSKKAPKGFKLSPFL